MKLLAILLALPLTLPATSLYFTFNGAQATNGNSAIGEGRIAFADGLTNVGLSDLTSFSFSDTEEARGNPGEPIEGVGVFAYSIPDLTSFSLQLSGTMPTSLLLTTRLVDAAGYRAGDFQQDFRVENNFIGLLTTTLESSIRFGPDPAAATPEPSSFALSGFAALLVGFGLWRRSATASLEL